MLHYVAAVCMRMWHCIENSNSFTCRFSCFADKPFPLQKRQKTMKEVAVDPSYAIFFLGTWQKSLFCCARLGWVAIGCILVLQAVPF
jgi:hypothetical protein